MVKSKHIHGSGSIKKVRLLKIRMVDHIVANLINIEEK